MRVLGIGHHVALGDLYLRLISRDCEVRVFAEEDPDVLEGDLPRCKDWREQLAWVGKDGVILFESTGLGPQQDELRAQGYRVFGGSAFGDRLELERHFGQQVAAACGMRTATTRSFHSFEDAIAFVRLEPARYVLKFDGDTLAKTRNYVARLDDGTDLIAMLQHQQRTFPNNEPPLFVLMDHLQGVEVGVGGFFDGRRFLTPTNLDFEHKRFFPGDLGELTGEMGTLVSYRHSEKLFAATLGRVAPLLAEARHVGYVNLNLIVNEEGAFPLEFTSRLGVPGFAILDALHVDPWDTILRRVLEREDSLATRDGYAVGVVLTVPPFPYPDGYERLGKNTPIHLHGIEPHEREHLHYAEVRRSGDQLLTAGQVGYVMVVTGVGATAQDARRSSYALVDKVVIPNLRYRADIGAAYELRDHRELVRLGWLPRDVRAMA
ncbi:MAG TPA: phosphoribosylglycinamide synthetase C domain-containing protein [Polyangiales bacterium]